MSSYRIPTMRSQENHTVPTIIDKAPCCGARYLTSDMFRYIGGISHDIRQAAGFHADQQYACDGCMATVFREGRVGHCEWHASIGAPPEHIEVEKKYMESFSYPVGSRGHALRMKHHPHLNPEK